MSKSKNETYLWAVEVFDNDTCSPVTASMTRSQARDIQARIRKDHPELKTQVYRYVPDFFYVVK